MNKFLKYLMMGAVAFSFTACGDDDPEPNPAPVPGGETETTVVNPSTVFPQGIPSRIGDMTVTKDAKGRVAKISSKSETITFSYLGIAPKSKAVTATVPATYDMTMSVTYAGESESYDFYLRLDNNGYVVYAYEVEKENGRVDDVDEWWFKYDANGRMTQLKRTEGDNEITDITYDANGDIVLVKVSDDRFPTGEMQSTISYTDALNVTPVVNKGGVMFFETFGIDMDELEGAFYAGLLGKATAHLPLSAIEVELDEPGYRTEYTYSWTLNAQGLPTRFQYIESDYYPDSPIPSVEPSLPCIFVW